ncbi:MAG: 5-oxoprolinase subunit PxpA [Hyphomonadaceae bacterium]|nr:5-oxoprolinase subunit PxpA [Hyphomonadaceae bacterium]
MSERAAMQIDLNADLGEGGPLDAELMSVVTSCNIACGGHAGDADSMRVAVRLAKTHGVSAGAHPSFPDRENFGRTASDLSGSALIAVLKGQVSDLQRIAGEEGVRLAHLKPHGALYNMAAKDKGLADSVAKVMKMTLPQATLVGPPGSALERAAKEQGLGFAAEGFADRAYENDGALRARGEPGAVIHDPEQQSKQALQIAIERSVTTYQGKTLALPVQTICVHGDTPAAFDAAKAIRASFLSHGLTVCAPH